MSTVLSSPVSPATPHAAFGVHRGRELPRPYGALRPPALSRRHRGHDSSGLLTPRHHGSFVRPLRGGAAIASRALGAVTLAPGDPIGDPEAGPAVIGAGEEGATIRARHGRDAVGTGDQAIVAWTAPATARRAAEGVPPTAPGPR